MRRRLFLSIVGVAIVAFPLGCGRPASKSPDNDFAAAEEARKAAEAAARQKAHMDERVPTLPADFPKDVPIPQKAKLISSKVEGKTTTVRFESDAPAAETAAFYERSLKILGWEILASTKSASGSVMGATKGGRTLSVTIVKGQPSTLITVGLSQP